MHIFAYIIFFVNLWSFVVRTVSERGNSLKTLSSDFTLKVQPPAHPLGDYVLTDNSELEDTRIQLGNLILRVLVPSLSNREHKRYYI